MIQTWAVHYTYPGRLCKPLAKETYPTSISHLRLARSTDGIRFQIAEAPTLGPANRYESFGMEDPRITCIDGMWDEIRIGAGAVPVRLDEGWLEIYHGAADTSLCYAEIPLPDVHENLSL